MDNEKTGSGKWLTVEQAKKAGMEEFPAHKLLITFDPDVWRGNYFGPKDDGSVSGAAAMLRRHALKGDRET
jgi:hypothetical protein